MLKTTIAVLALSLASLAVAQPGTFTGQHSVVSGMCITPITPNGETNCGYVGNIVGDPAAAYARVTDQTYLGFSWVPFTHNPPPNYPPNAPLVSSNWTGTIPWMNGMQANGSTTIAGGSCSMTGGPVGAYFAIYTVTCMGTDSMGGAAHKTHLYHTNVGPRGGWQPISDGGGYTGNVPGTVTFQTY